MEFEIDENTGIPYIEANGVGSTEAASVSKSITLKNQAFETEAMLYVENLTTDGLITFYTSMYQYITDLHVKAAPGPLIETNEKQRELAFVELKRRTIKYTRDFMKANPDQIQIVKDLRDLEEKIYGVSLLPDFTVLSSQSRK